MASVLLLLCFLITIFSLSLAHAFALVFALDKVSELFAEHEVSLEGIECSRHGHDLFIVRGFFSQNLLSLEVVTLAVGKDHEGLMGHSCEFLIEPAIILAADVLLEVVAWNDKIGIEQEPDRVVGSSTTGQLL